MKGKKYDSGKLRWSLVPWKAMRVVVRVLMYGADKYEPDNWLKVDQWERRYLNAAMRHQISILSGDGVYDKESGLHHWAHAICCLLFALERFINEYEERSREWKSRNT